MTSLSSAAGARRLVLIPAQPASAGGGEVRRYRLARLRLQDSDVARAERFEHLKRAHD